jgi:hypothetical protein
MDLGAHNILAALPGSIPMPPTYKPPEARLAAKAVSKMHKRVVQKYPHVYA